MKNEEYMNHRVKHDILETCYGNLETLEHFIAENNDENWGNRLTQAQDVYSWVRKPEKIELIQGSLAHLGEIIKTSAIVPVSILDVGCYGGYVFDYIEKIVLKDKIKDISYQGVDIREMAIKEAARLHNGVSNASFMVGDVFSLQDMFSDSKFDIVFCSRVLIHLPNFEKAVTNLINVSNNVTFIVVKVSNKPDCKKIRKTDLDTGEEMIYFYRTFSEKMLAEVAERKSLTIKIIKCPGGYSSVIFYQKGLCALRSYGGLSRALSFLGSKLSNINCKK